MALDRLIPTSGTVTGQAFADAAQEELTGLWNNAIIPLTSVGGTADAITASCSPALTAGLVEGMKFELTPSSDNTGAVTLAINGGSPIDVVDDKGDPLGAGRLVSGRRHLLMSDGTNLRVFNSSGLRVEPDLQTFTADGTWTKPAGAPDDALVFVQLWGGGGGGGGNDASTNNARAGGGGGGYNFGWFRLGDLASTVAVTVGLGGAAENAGGTSSFGTHISAFGGGYGGRNNSSTAKAASGGAGGGIFSAGGNGTGSSDGTTVTVSNNTTTGDPLAGYGGGATATVSGSTESPTAGGRGILTGGAGGGGSARASGDATGADGGAAQYGGGGGGGGQGGNGGVSQFGGNGGAATVNGSAPGGGGGAFASGARGEVRVWVIG
jgi:hypothetical protein